jgi:hypothetical protein
MPATTNLVRNASAIAFLLFIPVASHADHGPGTSGGGATTQSGETLKPGKFSFDVRIEYTEFQNLTTEEIESKAAKAGAFDLLDRSFLYTVSVGYGVIENWQVALSIGYYDAVQAREAEFDSSSGETEILTFNPDGVTDLWLTTKYRFYRGPWGQFAAVAGVKFPTGDDDVRNSEGERVEPSATAGSGSFDGMAGLAYSRWLTPRMTLDASAQYTFRTEHADFRLGDRIDAGVTVAYRLTPDIEKYPQVSVFAEANLRHLFKSDEEGEPDPNTGGTVFFLSPGVRLSAWRNAALTLSAQVPVVQDLNGTQLKTDFRVLAALTTTF